MSDSEPDLKFDAEYLRTLEYLLDTRPSPRPVMKVGQAKKLQRERRHKAHARRS
jgi:hypothetical protein